MSNTSGIALCCKNRYVLVVSRAGIPFAPFASYLHSFPGGVCSGLWGQALNLVVRLGRRARKRILLCQLFPAVAFDKGPYSLATPSTLPQPTPTPPTCQWISNYWPSWGRIFGWLYLMWQQQVRWSGSGPRLRSVTVPEEKGNLNWCWGPAAPLFIFHMGSGLVIPLNSESRLSKGCLWPTLHHTL